ncbi:endonuclease VII [Pantoea phage vB_PagM_LIET2]|uniref:Endonuclease n=1 Tax=Pantoea phage vB_PagM_LIET2 TaxID=2508071 RepID=A0A411AW81_9CAUD|nr:endonuclease VII [Pantoea phage vB_PagM_LIET2]QAX92361.1 endonuclease [Pantoea phage vB_PagM_LIET2]
MNISSLNKRCSRCGEMKPLATAFHHRSDSRDGHVGICKACRNKNGEPRVKATSNDGMKCCSECGELKPLATGFHRKAGSADGYTCACRACRNRISKQWRDSNPEYGARWREENRDYIRTRQRALREKNADTKSGRRIDRHRHNQLFQDSTQN